MYTTRTLKEDSITKNPKASLMKLELLSRRLRDNWFAVYKIPSGIKGIRILRQRLVKSNKPFYYYYYDRGLSLFRKTGYIHLRIGVSPQFSCKYATIRDRITNVAENLCINFNIEKTRPDTQDFLRIALLDFNEYEFTESTTFEESWEDQYWESWENPSVNQYLQSLENPSISQCQQFLETKPILTLIADVGEIITKRVVHYWKNYLSTSSILITLPMKKSQDSSVIPQKK